MTTHLVLFTRDLRLDDHPALTAAVERADAVLPLFVLDEHILQSRYAAPNRVSYLLDGLRDLRAGLRRLGSDLVVRRGRVEDVVADLVTEHDVATVHVTGDVSRYARRREERLRDVLGERGAGLDVHPGHLVVEAGEVTPDGGDHYKVFTPYWRRWVDATWRVPIPAPTGMPGLPSLDPGEIPDRAELVDGQPSRRLPTGGETAALARWAAYLDDGIDDYERARDVLADDATSRLSADLHLGMVSAARVADDLDRRRSGHDALLRQLCWREFNHQLLAANPDLPRTAYRDRGDSWRSDDDAFKAWTEGRTGVPIVDAGMRQLREEGWMHNRARLLTASFLTKHLYVDWRLGADHFAHWLVDGDVANNWASWQWVAGTGTDTRPNRMFNPVRQAERYDPDGRYVRRWVPELAHLDTPALHAPWTLDETLLQIGDSYPPPLVDHDEARQRFLDARGG